MINPSMRQYETYSRQLQATSPKAKPPPQAEVSKTVATATTVEQLAEQSVFEHLGIAAGDFIAVQDGSLGVKDAEKLLQGRSKNKGYIDTTHIASVVSVSKDQIKLLEADSKGVRVRTMNVEQFKKHFIDYGKGGIAVIKQRNNTKLANEIAQVTRDFAAQYATNKGSYGWRRFFTGIFSRKTATQDTFKELAETAKKDNVNRVKDLPTDEEGNLVRDKDGKIVYEEIPRFVSKTAAGKPQTISVCSELATKILQTAQLSLALKELPQSPGSVTAKTVEKLTRPTLQDHFFTDLQPRISDLHAEATTPAAFMTTMKGLGCAIRIIKPEDLRTAQAKVKRQEQARRTTTVQDPDSFPADVKRAAQRKALRASSRFT